MIKLKPILSLSITNRWWHKYNVWLRSHPLNATKRIDRKIHIRLLWTFIVFSATRLFFKTVFSFFWKLNYDKWLVFVLLPNDVHLYMIFSKAEILKWNIECPMNRINKRITNHGNARINITRNAMKTGIKQMNWVLLLLLSPGIFTFYWYLY